MRPFAKPLFKFETDCTHIDQQMDSRDRPEALLQRLQQICPKQIIHRPLPLAASTLVTTTASPQWPGRFIPSSSRRYKFPRHVHPRHGVCHLHPAFHIVGRPTRSVPPRITRQRCNMGIPHCLFRDSGDKTSNLPSQHKQREPASRSGCLLGIQVCGH